LPSKDTATPERTPEHHDTPSEYIHEFEFYCDWAHNVSIAGEFTNWKPELHLQKESSSNKWVLKHKFPIIKGETQRYQYKFVIDGKNWELNTSFPT